MNVFYFKFSGNSSQFILSLIMWGDNNIFRFCLLLYGLVVPSVISGTWSAGVGTCPCLLVGLFYTVTTGYLILNTPLHGDKLQCGASKWSPTAPPKPPPAVSLSSE